jgi:hypothetical protein
MASTWPCSAAINNRENRAAAKSHLGLASLRGSGPLAHPWCLDWSPDGRQYVVGTEEGDVWTVRLPEPEEPSALKGHLSPTKKRQLTKCHVRTPSQPLNAWYVFPKPPPQP